MMAYLPRGFILLVGFQVESFARGGEILVHWVLSWDPKALPAPGRHSTPASLSNQALPPPSLGGLCCWETKGLEPELEASLAQDRKPQSAFLLLRDGEGWGEVEGGEEEGKEGTLASWRACHLRVWQTIINTSDLLKGASGMMTASICLFLIFLILPEQLVLGQSQRPLDDLLNKKIEEQASSYVLATLQKLQLICSSVTSRGALANCPSGSTVTGCSCGSACGSWDVRGTTTCHCQCAGMDWTSARCCRFGN